MAKKDKEKKQKYYSTNKDKIQKKMDELGSGKYYKPKEGKSYVRILPPWSKEGLWYKEATMHYGLANEEGKERGLACLKQFGEDCPICEAVNNLATGDAEDQKMAKRMRAKTKYYSNIIDRKTGAVCIWGYSAKTLGILLSYDQDPDFGDISNPEEGFDVVIEREGTDLKTKYNFRCRPKSSEAGEDWEDNMVDLDTEVIKEITEEEAQEIVDLNFGDTASKKSKKKKKDDDEDEEDEPKSKKKSSKEDDDDEDEEPKSKKKKKPVDDEDEEEEPVKEKKKPVDEDDDDEDEPKDKKKKSSDEEDDPEDLGFKVGDKVTFEDDDDDEIKGKINKINQKKGTAIVEDSEGDEYSVPLDDLELAKSKKKKKKEDDDD